MLPDTLQSFIAAFPLPGLFLVSFLASTLLPLGSEWLIAALIAGGHPPAQCIALATLGNTLGAYTSYLVGLFSADWCLRKLFRLDAKRQAQAERLFTRFGSWSLLLSWLPVIGDPLCLVGGLLRVPFGRFLVLVAVGKLGRYLVVGWLAGAVFS